MHDHTSKQLYMDNGGNKIYIYKDGFGDVYSATPEEEARWAKEVVERALTRIETEKNQTVLEFAINDLVFHKFANIEGLLIKMMQDTSPGRQIAFASALWKIARHQKSFDIIMQNLQQHRDECLDNVFSSLINFKYNEAAQKFLVACLEGTDEVLHAKAQITIGMWSYTGMSILRDDNLLGLLKFENKQTDAFTKAIAELKQIFKVENFKR